MAITSVFATAAKHHYDGSISVAQPLTMSAAPAPEASLDVGLTTGVNKAWTPGV